jgi:hypothetical protein
MRYVSVVAKPQERIGGEMNNVEVKLMLPLGRSERLKERWGKVSISRP